MHRVAHRPGRGISLIEILVVVTISSTILVLSVSTIRQLGGLEKRVARETHALQQLRQFGRIWRRDLLMAEDVRLAEDDPQRLILRLSTRQRVEYQGGEEGLVRQRYEVGELRHRERFQYLSAEPNWEIQPPAIGDGSQPGLVSAELQPDGLRLRGVSWGIVAMSQTSRGDE